jgi:hypothetical protein
VAEYVASCLTCQKAKVEHQRPVGMLQSLDIYPNGSGKVFQWILWWDYQEPDIILTQFG